MGKNTYIKPVATVDTEANTTEQEVIVDDTVPTTEETTPDTEVNTEVPPVDTETTEEPIPEETPEEVIPTPEETATVPASVLPGVLDIDGVKKVLSDNTSLKEKLDTIAKQALPKLSMLVVKLLGYNETMRAEVIDSKVGAPKQYDLYNTLMSVINTVDYNEFKVKFDVVNTVFLAYKDESFKDVKLFRFDNKWTWGSKELITFHHLITIITILADLSKRKENLKKIDMVKALDSTETGITAAVSENIQKYYNM